MKKVILICLAMMMLSCKTFFYGVEPTFTMGMSEKEFVEKNKPELVSATEEGDKVYRTFNHLTNYKFFYFRNEKLVRFEKGTYPEEYKFDRLL
jgi:hypothetical protein